VLIREDPAGDAVASSADPLSPEPSKRNEGCIRYSADTRQAACYIFAFVDLEYM
jgi:hypothetical protein